MENEVIIYNDNEIQNRILTIKNQQVMIDRDLAEFYGVETKVLNQAVKRNIERFPSNFMFQLSDDEKNELVTNCDRFKTLKHSSSLPYAFTEQGVAMLSAVLKSDAAVRTSIMIRKLCQVKGMPEKEAECLEVKRQAMNDSITNRGNPSDDVKSASGEIYTNIKRILQLTRCGNDTHSFLRDTMAPLLTSDMTLYAEIKQCIFGD